MKFSTKIISCQVLKKGEDNEIGSKVNEKSPKFAVCSKNILQLTGKLFLPARYIEIGLIVVCSKNILQLTGELFTCQMH